MKKMNNRITLLCLLLAVLTLFGSCNGGSTQNGDSTVSDETEAPTVETEPQQTDARISIIEGGKMLYRVVSAKKAGDTEQEAVNKIVMALNDSGIRPNLCDDSSYDADTLDIVIGTSVDYPEVKTVKDGLRYNDYALTKVGNKIVITAGNDDALLTAANYFVKKIISGTQRVNGRVDLSLAEYTYRAKYALEGLTVNGVSIGEWTLVYPTDTRFSYEWAAEYWHKTLGEKTGYDLKLVSGTSENVAHAIVLGADAEETSVDLMQYRIRVSDSALSVTSGGVYSAGLAAEELVKSALAKGSKLDSSFTCQGDLMTAPKMALSDNSNLRLMSSNILADLASWGGSPLDWRVEILAANVKFYQPDVVGLQETTSTWVDALSYYFADGSYRIISNFTDKGKENYSCILYNTQTLTLKENGCKTYTDSDNNRCRHMGWGIFTEKKSGKDFAFISTHWNLGKNMVYSQGEDLWAFIQKLSADGTRSVFSVGDYNTGEYGAYYGKLMEISTLKNMKRVTTNLVNDIGTEKGLGKTASSSTPTIDFILGTEDTSCQMFMTLIGNCVADMSDHSALLADVSVR